MLWCLTWESCVLGWSQSPQGALPGLQLQFQKCPSLLEVLSSVPQLCLRVSGTGMLPEAALSPGCLLVTVCKLLLQGHAVPCEGWLQDWSLPGESREQTPGLTPAWVLLAGLAHGPWGQICAREEFALP